MRAFNDLIEFNFWAIDANILGPFGFKLNPHWKEYGRKSLIKLWYKK